MYPVRGRHRMGGGRTNNSQNAISRANQVARKRHTHQNAYAAAGDKIGGASIVQPGKRHHGFALTAIAPALSTRALISPVKHVFDGRAVWLHRQFVGFENAVALAGPRTRTRVPGCTFAAAALRTSVSSRRNWPGPVTLCTTPSSAKTLLLSSRCGVRPVTTLVATMLFVAADRYLITRTVPLSDTMTGGAGLPLQDCRDHGRRCVGHRGLPNVIVPLPMALTVPRRLISFAGGELATTRVAIGARHLMYLHASRHRPRRHGRGQRFVKRTGSVEDRVRVHVHLDARQRQAAGPDIDGQKRTGYQALRVDDGRSGRIGVADNSPAHFGWHPQSEIVQRAIPIGVDHNLGLRPPAAPVQPRSRHPSR